VTVYPFARFVALNDPAACVCSAMNNYVGYMIISSSNSDLKLMHIDGFIEFGM
jgi:hypothetical protein